MIEIPRKFLGTILAESSEILSHIVIRLITQVTSQQSIVLSKARDSERALQQNTVGLRVESSERGLTGVDCSV